MFQRQVNVHPAPAVAGQFASDNPRASAPAGPFGYVAGPGGVTIGTFVWPDANGFLVNAGAGVPLGFIANEQQALITAYLADSGMVVPQGFMLTPYVTGDYWAKTSTAAVLGQKIFASLTTGAICTGAPAAVIAGFIETKWFVAAPCLAGELVKFTSYAQG